MFAFTIPIASRPAQPRRLRLPLAGDEADHDGVRLRPEWPALIAMTRFARRATWLFGSRSAVLECAERRPRPCRRRCRSGDPIHVRLDLAAWTHAVARRRGTARELEFFAGGSSAITAVHLEDCDAALDESIWRLIDDAPSALDRRCRVLLPAPAALAVPAVPDAIARGLGAAVDAGIRVAVHLENAGGSVCWIPDVQQCLAGPDYVELRSRYGRMQLSRDGGPARIVHRLGAEAGGPSIEAENGFDGGRVRLDSADAAGPTAWRRICHELSGG